MTLRADLVPIVEALFVASKDTGEVTLDAIGDALDRVTAAISTDDIDAIMCSLEARGRRIEGPRTDERSANDPRPGEERLRVVLATARSLMVKLGRRPTVPEIADAAALEEKHVRHALALARIMQR
jgi:hypothetical protein